MKKRITAALCFVIMLCLLFGTAAAASAGSEQQIVYAGGGETKDGITVNKIVEGTEKENYFDITLTVTAEGTAEELLPPERTAVVIVLDASYTMNSVAGTLTRLESAKQAAAEFLGMYCGSEELGEREIGIVAFDTNAYTVLPLSDTEDASAAIAAVNGIKTAAVDSHDRFTNIEGGLKLAGNLLSKSDAVHKYVILLTDGFPTTYIKSGADSADTIMGYDPYGSADYKPGEDGYFFDAVEGIVCSATSYSDTAAARAADAASALKKKGINIFSVGIDIGGQTINKYIETGKNNGISIVERDASGKYVIGDPSDASSYKTWLGKSIGGGSSVKDAAYCDGDDLEGMRRAYELILEEIKSISKESYADVWSVEDFMGEDVRFLWFYDRNGTPAGNELAGENVEHGENTAVFEDGISWDLRKSGYTEADGTYVYKLKYGVRLANETVGFVGGEDVPANGKAVLTYKTMENGVLSEKKELLFPMPQIEGYLGKLVFKKVCSKTGELLDGAWFMLAHGEDCGVCGGSVHIDAISAAAVKGEGSIEGIPSGHTYTLTEEAAPEGYVPSGPMKVSIIYGEATLFDGEGAPISEIKNEPEEPEVPPVLPQTGDDGGVWPIVGVVLSAVLLGALAAVAAVRKIKKI